MLELIGTYDVILHDSQGEVEYHYVLNHYLARALTESTQSENPEADVSWFHPDALPLEEMPPPILSLIESVLVRIRILMCE